MADIVHMTQKLPDAVIGVAYEAALAYSGELSAVSASSVSSGSLPPGLALDAVAPFTRITGTPTLDGLFTFRITLTNAGGPSQSPTLTIRVVTANIDDQNNYSPGTLIRQEWPLS